MVGRKLPALLPNNPQATAKTVAPILLTTVIVTFAILLSSVPAHATLSLGSVTSQTSLLHCPSPGSHWATYTTGGTTSYMNCVTATLTGCPNAQDLNFTYGWLIPSGIPLQGTIVYFDGGAGTDAAAEGAEVDMLDYYLTQGYEVIQVAWNTAWEATWNNTPSPPAPVANIQNAACRPATFLNYVDTADSTFHLYNAVLASNSAAGMCAQGFSAGSAAVAYSLAYYGAGSYLDNVELIAGPVLSDIEQGCQEGPQASPVTICGPDSHGNPQYGCQLGSLSYWTTSPTYVPGENTDVQTWTNDNTCANPSSGSSSATSEKAWLAQSIVDQPSVSGGATPTFTYSNTGMAAWLCRSVKNLGFIDCATDYQFEYCPNNSSPQGEVFYNNFTASNHPPVYNVWAVDQCIGPEGAPQGGVGTAGGTLGQTAIQQDMAGTSGFPPGACTHRSR
jgi:hypothetical protein